MREIAEVSASPAIGHGDAEQSLFTELRPEITRKFIRAVYVGGAWRDAFTREAPYLRADLLEIRA